MHVSNALMRRNLILAAAVVLASTTPCLAQFADLAARVPDGANAIFLIDVDQILRSSMATKEDWRNQKQQMVLK